MIINPYRFSAAGGTGYLLDDYPGASAAYSLRELTTTSWNIGDVVIQARNSSNDTDTFTSAEVFDGTLVAFADLGDGSAYVQRWYDQSGNVNTILQSLATDQPLLVSGGVLLADGLKFDGTDDYFDCGFSAGSATGQSIFAVAQTSDLAANRMLLDGRDGNDDGVALFFQGSATADFMRWSADLNGTPSGADTFTPSLSANVEHLFAGIFATPNNTISLDGVEEDTSASAPATIDSTTSYKIGRSSFSSAAFWQGSIQEVIIYPDDQSANQAGIDGNITTHYGI